MRERRRSIDGATTAPWVALAACVLLAAAPAAAVERRCVSAEIDEAMVMPDGSVQPAGTLTLCDSRALSPVAALHETRVNGRGIGMFVSHVRVAESAPDVDPVAVFERRGDGRIVLIGYTVPVRGRSVSYQLAPSSERDPSAPELLVLAMR